MKKIFKTRTKCRLCNSKKIKEAINFGETIIAEKYLDNLKSKKSLSAPMKIFHCLNCSHVQLVNIVDPNYLWNNFTFKTKNNTQLVKHFQNTAKRILKNIKLSNTKCGVLDIGSNDGSLLRAFKSLKVNRVLGIDPAKNIVDEANKNGIKTILGYFGKGKLKQINRIIEKPKIITAFNAFAHSDDIREMTYCISKILHKEGIFVFEASYFLDVYKKKLLGTFFHEHLDYHKIFSLKKFFKIFDLELFKVERNQGQGGSIVVYVKKRSNNFKIHSSVKNLIKLEKKEKLNLFFTTRKLNEEFIFQKKNINNILEKIKEKKQTIFGYGSSRSSATFLSYFKIGKYLKFINDSNKIKIGKYTPGDKIKVIDIQSSLRKKPDYFLILAWVHTNKIIRENNEYLKNGGKFIKIFPKISIVKK
jgi:2-polyprenyl-3-methyl-5-hydroxy-6-metoxy-1,4-benzoquinol methylase